MKNRKAIAIFTAFLMLGAIIYQASANEGVYESYDDSIVASFDEADGATDYGEDDAFLDAVHPDIDIDLELGYLDDTIGDWGYFDLEDYHIEESEGEFVGITPMWARPTYLPFSVECYYTRDLFTIDMLIPPTWGPPYSDYTPGPFSVSFNLADAPPVPEGWSVAGAQITYAIGDHLLAENPMQYVGNAFIYHFPFEFNQGPGFVWEVAPTFILFVRPDPATIVKDVAPVYPGTFPVSVGDEVEYTITVTNPAANPTIGLPGVGWVVSVFDNFRVVDNLPPELALVPGTVEVSGGTNVVDSSANNVIDVTFSLPGSNEPDHTVVITFRATVTEAALLVSEIINIAYLSHPYHPDDKDTETVPLPELPPELPPPPPPPPQPPQQPQPPVTEPPVTEPPVTQPPVTQPPGVAPKTGDDGVFVTLIYMLLAAMTAVSLISLTIGEKRRRFR